MRVLVATAATVALLATAACGSSRPSADEISEALQKGVGSSQTAKSDATKQRVKLKKTGADCVGKVFEASKLSDADLRKIVDDRVYPQSKANDKILQGLANKLSKCNVT